MSVQTIREEIEEGCLKSNPPPCNADVCGINGIPCPRCQNVYYERLVAYAEWQERQRIVREIEE